MRCGGVEARSWPATRISGTEAVSREAELQFGINVPMAAMSSIGFRPAFHGATILCLLSRIDGSTAGIGDLFFCTVGSESPPGPLSLPLQGRNAGVGRNSMHSSPAEDVSALRALLP